MLVGVLDSQSRVQYDKTQHKQTLCSAVSINEADGCQCLCNWGVRWKLLYNTRMC